MEKVKKYLKYIVPSIIAILILLLIYLIKGIYPFGNMTIAHADMGQSYETFYHLLWDAIRSGKSILYSYVLGSGSNIFGGVLLDGFASPLAWIIALFSREKIIYAFSYMLVIKVGIIALTSYIFFNKMYKDETNKSEFWKVAFSVMFALSAYTIISYTNIMWLDIVAIFPIFCLGIYRLVTKNKADLFIATLTLCLIISYYISYMILFFILSCIPFVILFYAKKEDRKRVSGKVIIATILALCISMFSFLPAFSQTMSSYRMAGEPVKIVKNDEVQMKMIFLLFSGLGILGTLKLTKQFKKDNIAKMLLLSILVSGILPIAFERVNALWHTGSHNSFPFRYGFIPIFIMFNAAMYYFTKYYKTTKNDKNTTLIYKVLYAFSIIIALFIIIFLSIGSTSSINANEPAMRIEKMDFAVTCIQAVAFCILFTELLEINNIKIRNTLISVVIFVEILVHGLPYIGVPEESRYGAEHSDISIKTANEIINNFEIKENELYRYKDVEQLMTENYPLVTNTPSMSTFLHVITRDQAVTHSKLGYTINYTKLGDTGGTLVSDAILGLKYVFSSKNLDTDTYNLVKGTDTTKLYELKNILPYGIIYQNDNDLSTIPEEYNAYQAQNYLYKNLLNKTEDLVKEVEPLKEKKENTCKYTIKVDEKSHLYVLKESKVSRPTIKSIRVNGQQVLLPTINNKENSIYKTRYMNGIIDLGAFENETVEVELDVSKDINDEKFALVPIKEYEKMCAQYEETIPEIKIDGNKITIKCNIEEENKKLYLPITFDTGWTGSNNGQEIKINKVFNTHMSFDLQKGENEIKLTFIPAKMKLGIEITIITLALILIYNLIIKRFIKKDGIIDKIMVNLGFGLYIIITLGFYLKVYIISIIKTFTQYIK